MVLFVFNYIENKIIIILKKKLNKDTNYNETMPVVSLKVNDNDIDLNEFMEKMLTNILLGYLESVKRVPDDIKTINIEIIV